MKIITTIKKALSYLYSKCVTVIKMKPSFASILIIALKMNATESNSPSDDQKINSSVLIFVCYFELCVIF